MKKNIILKHILVVFIIVMALLGKEVKAETRNNDPLLRNITINEKEIEPQFDQFITDYVIVTDNEKIDVSAETDDPNASYEIIGDTNLKSGINELEIKVTAEDQKTTMSYYLHITRTEDTEKSNANLKNLEVKDFELSPKFNSKDIKYYIQYENIIDKLDITATAEKENAKVEITGNENYDTGSVQLINIKVTAEDGITTKNYQIIAKMKKDNEDEEQGLEQYENKRKEIDNEKQRNSNIKVIGMSIIIIVLIIGIIIIIRRKKTKGKKC